MKRRELLSVVPCLGALSILPGQTAPASSLIKEMFLPHWKVSKDFTLEVMEAMPPASFNFRPAPEEMAFGQLFMHLGYFNTFLLAKTVGENTPFKLTGEKDEPEKEVVRKFLTETFDYTISTLERVKESELRETRQLSRTMTHTGAEMILRAYMHTTHHRGQSEVYLRLKGIKPPAFKF